MCEPVCVGVYVMRMYMYVCIVSLCVGVYVMHMHMHVCASEDQR